MTVQSLLASVLVVLVAAVDATRLAVDHSASNALPDHGGNVAVVVAGNSEILVNPLYSELDFTGSGSLDSDPFLEGQSLLGQAESSDLRPKGAGHKKMQKAKRGEVTWSAIVGMVLFILLLPLTCMHLFDIESEKFQQAVGIVICCNTVVLCLETDLPPNIGFEIAANLFNLIFILEACLRIKEIGCPYFKSGWNLFDCVLIASGTAELWIFPLIPGVEIDMSQMKVLKVCRCLRLVRLLRMFKELMVICIAFADALTTVCWTGLLIFLMDLIMAIFFTQLIGQESEQWEDAADAALVQKRFGTIADSMYTLFMIMTLDSWSDLCSVIMKKYYIVLFVFIMYIIIAAYTMVSLITGIISDSLICRRAQQDQAYIETAQQQFVKELDADASATISKEEISNAMQQEDSLTKLEGLDIGLGDTEELNELFDILAAQPGKLDDQGAIPTKDFIDAFKAMQGQATAKSIFQLNCDIRQLKDDTGESIRQLTATVQDLSTIVQALAAKVDNITK